MGDRVTGRRPDALDLPRRGPVEDGAVFGKGEPFGGILDGLPVGVHCTALHIVDRLAVHFERRQQLHQRLDCAEPDQRRVLELIATGHVPGPDSGEVESARPEHIHHAATAEMALERARRLFFDLSPRHVRDRSKLAMQVIHCCGTPLRLPMSSAPVRCCCWWSDRNPADGAKNSVPVTGCVKSSRRS